MFKNVLIIGLGLMGGSIARAIRDTQTTTTISAFDMNAESLQYALEHGLIDNGSQNLQKLAESADLIIIATPLHAYNAIFSALSGFKLSQ